MCKSHRPCRLAALFQSSLVREVRIAKRTSLWQLSRLCRRRRFCRFAILPQSQPRYLCFLDGESSKRIHDKEPPTYGTGSRPVGPMRAAGPGPAWDVVGVPVAIQCISVRYRSMATTMVHVRVDEKTKQRAAKTLAGMGISVSDAVRMLLVRVAAEKALPFEVRVPNATTVK